MILTQKGRKRDRLFRADNVAVAGTDDKFRPIHPDPDGLAIAGRAGTLWVIAENVLPAKLFGNAFERRRKAARRRFGSKQLSAGYLRQLCEVCSAGGVCLGDPL